MAGTSGKPNVIGRNIFFMSIGNILLFLSSASLFGVNGSTRCEREFGEFKRKCESYHIRTTKALKEISAGIQPCQAATRLETELRQERDAKSALEMELRQERTAKAELELQLRQEQAKARQAKDLITGKHSFNDQRHYCSSVANDTSVIKWLKYNLIFANT